MTRSLVEIGSGSDQHPPRLRVISRRWEDAFSVVAPQINAEGVHIWPFDPSLPVAVRHVRFDSVGSIRMTRHSYHELILASSTDIPYRIQSTDFVVKRGELLVLNGSLYHGLRANPHNGRMVVMYFEPHAIGTEEGEDGAQLLMPFRFGNLEMPRLVEKASGISSEILRLLERMDSNLPASTAMARLTVRTCLKMILVLLADHFFRTPVVAQDFLRAQKRIARLQPLFDRLNRDCGSAMTLDGAATLLGMSRSQFVRFFRQATGQSFISYVTRFRVQRAQAMLATTDKSIYEIGEELGFSDQSYFGVVFRKIAHMSPLRYRQLHG